MEAGLSSLTRRSAVGVPDRRRLSGSSPVVNATRPGCGWPTSATMSVSLMATSVNVAVLFLAAGRRPSEPSAEGRSDALSAYGAGQSRCVIHCAGPISTSARGSFVMPLRTPCSQRSNQRCSVSTHRSLRPSKSNGSTCWVWPTQILRGTFLSARAFHQVEKLSGLTLRSLTVWMTKTLALTLETSPSRPLM